MFDIGLGEVLVLIVAALFVFGPDRLPQVIAQAARTIRQLRTLAAGARAEITEAIGPELRELNLKAQLDELNPLSDIDEIRSMSPRKILNNAMFGSDDTIADAAAPGPASNGSAGPSTPSAPLAPPATAYDADAT